MHHAYLFIGSPEAASKKLTELFGRLIASPDYFPWRGGVFGIDEARALAEAAQRKAFGERKVFFISPERITLEAQNALLKSFEEPVAGTHFVLSVRDEGPILMTLRSRMALVRLEGSAPAAEAASFLKQSPVKRLAFTKKFVEAEKSLPGFLDDLLLVLRREGSVAGLAEAYKMRSVADQRGASARLVLEHLSLVL